MLKTYHSLIKNEISESILKTSEQLTPSSDEMRSWSSLYIKDHLNRLVDDAILALKACELSNGHKIADVGSTPPVVAAYLSQLGKDISAIDINPYRLLLPEDCNVKLIQHNIEDFSSPCLPGGAYDVIIFTEVIEHLRISPPRSLKILYDSLRSGGTLVLSTPNLWSYRGLRNFILSQRSEVLCSRPEIEYRKLESIGHMGHVREYTFKEISSLLCSCGFKVIETRFRQYPNQTSFAETLITKLLPTSRNNVAMIALKE